MVAINLKSLSKIQIRRGLDSDLPILDEGELALSKDIGAVYIGAPNCTSLQYRAPGVTSPSGIFPYTNLKILTEKDVQRDISNDVYFYGPLDNYIITNNNGNVSGTYSGSGPLSGIYTFTNFFSFSTTNMTILEVTSNGTHVSSNAYSYSGHNLIINSANLVNPIPSGATIVVYYVFPVQIFSEAISSNNTFIYDYSLVAQGTPSEASAMRRIGLLTIVTDGTIYNINDDFNEMNVTFPGQTNVIFGCTISGGNLIISALNNSSYSQKLWINGRQWLSTT